jgi:hypothetical protein
MEGAFCGKGGSVCVSLFLLFFKEFPLVFDSRTWVFYREPWT